MKIKSLFIVFLVFVIRFSSAQQGNYFLNQYIPTEERIDYVTYGMAQDQNGVIYFANKSGVIEFDGRNWGLISTPGPVYAIAIQGQEVFVAGFNGFGKLVWGENNSRGYQSLSDGVAGATQLFSSLADKDKVYFLNEQSLHVFTTSTSVKEVIKADAAQGTFTGLYEISGKIYVNTTSQGFFKIDQGKLVKSDFSLPGNQQIVFCSTLTGKNKALAGSDAGSLFVITEAVTKEINVKDKTFLESNGITGGSWVSENLIAIGTLRGGVIFINPETGTTEEVTNFYTGLPDNEVYALLCDRNQGVWVAHDYGFTRIAPYLPFRSYSHYKGLEGNLLCASNFKGQAYVGTTLGLFGLVKEEVYDEITYKSSSNKGGIFSFLHKGKKRELETPSAKTLRNRSPKVSKPVLKSVRYRFKKVDGIDGKITQMIEANGKLLAAGVNGIAEIEGFKSKTITRDPVRSMFISPSLQQLLASTLNEEIKTFASGAGGWKETHLLDTLQDYVSYIFEDKLENIWLCSRTSIYKVETVDNLISNIEAIPFSNPAIDETVGLAYGSEVYVAASGTINRFNSGKNNFEKFDSIPGPKKYFASAGYFWFNDGHRWRTVDPRVQASLKLEWLGLFHNIRFIAPVGKDEGLWVITAANELYRFSSNKVTESANYPLFLKEVRGQQSKMVPTRSIKVSQLESTVTFEFIQPDYLGMKAVEYRYIVKGLNKNWSTWSADNNIVNFSYLPTGNYKIEVQTRDIMNRVSEVQQIELEVEPPYWKRSWFYAAEFSFFAMLVLISMRMQGAKYGYISRLLTLLTIIMLMQFIETAVAAQISITSSPVLEFFIQVFIALLVLPLEGYLTKFIRRGEKRNIEVKS